MEFKTSPKASVKYEISFANATRDKWNFQAVGVPNSCMKSRKRKQVIETSARQTTSKLLEKQFEYKVRSIKLMAQKKV